ncbi:MAG: 50S ribosomal protein L33 [Mycoplasmataceae bacterium]|nr:50S ribosomal protein L33 [Mycoplasmataceae bacterium]
MKIILVCSECNSRNYHYNKSKFNSKRLELNKYCSCCKKYTVHKETR